MIKKLLVLILSLILLFPLASCNNKKGDEYFIEITISAYVQASKTESFDAIVTPSNNTYNYTVKGDLFKCYVNFKGTIYKFIEGRKVGCKTIIFGNIFPNGEENKEYCDATYSYEVENEAGQKEKFELKRPSYAPDILLPDVSYRDRDYSYYLQEKSGKHVIKLSTQKYEKYGIDKGEYEFVLNVVDDDLRKEVKLEMQNYSECVLAYTKLNGCDAFTVSKNKRISYKVKDKEDNVEVVDCRADGLALKLDTVTFYYFNNLALTLEKAGIYHCKILINELNGYKPIAYYFYLIVV